MLARLSGHSSEPPTVAPDVSSLVQARGRAVAGFGLGCFWAGELSFDCASGVTDSVVGYAKPAAAAAAAVPAATVAVRSTATEYGHAAAMAAPYVALGQEDEVPPINYENYGQHGYGALWW